MERDSLTILPENISGPGLWPEPSAVRLARGRFVAPYFFLARFSSNALSALSTISAVSPLGTAWRSRSFASRSFSHVLPLAVNVTW